MPCRFSQPYQITHLLLTLQQMAPEVVKQTQYTRKADIWSLGCMVVEMFTNDHPFPEFSQMQAMFQVSGMIWYDPAKVHVLITLSF
jgi:serine/threonine protein kinase